MSQQQENFTALMRGLAGILSNPEKISAIRPSQQKVLRDFLQSPEQFKTGIFDLATAFGKTRIMALLTEAYRTHANHQVVIVEPTQELVNQISSEFSNYFGDSQKIGQFFADRKDTIHPILVTTYNSLDKLAQTINPEDVGLLLLDEGHHAVSDRRMEIVKRFSHACQYGMTATPDYSEDRTLKNLLKNTIAHVDIKQGIHDGILSPFSNVVLLSKFQMDLSQIKKSGNGDYDIAEYRQAFSKALSSVHLANTEDADWRSAHRKVAAEIALFYQGMAPYKKHCLINCYTQEEAQIQAEEINKLFGKEVAGVWTTDTKGTNALQDFESGKISALCQVGMLQEGYDFPALDLCINYPTASPVRATQRGGRTLRLDPDNPDKNATIVDIVFSFPNSQNPYTSARKNGQVLYADVVKAIYVAPKSLGNQRKVKDSFLPEIPELNLQNFTLVSNVQTLLSLKRKDQQKEAAEYIPFKQQGMLSSNDIVVVLGGTPSKYFKLFQEIYEDPALNTCMDSDDKPFQLIQRVRSSNVETLCLSNHPEAMQEFIEICDERYHKRYEDRISLEEYARGHYLPKEILHKIGLFLHGLKFQTEDLNGAQHSLISKYQRRQDTLLFMDTREAREDLNALITLTDFLSRVPVMPKDMCDYDRFVYQMGLCQEDTDRIIQQLVLEGKTYKDKNGNRKPLAQFYRGEKEPVFGICVPKDPKGQEELLRAFGFKVYHRDASEVFDRPNLWEIYKKKQRENCSLYDIAETYNISAERVRQIFCYIGKRMLGALREACFIRDKKVGCWVVHRDPQGKEALYLSNSEGDFLVIRDTMKRGYSRDGYSGTAWLRRKSIDKILRIDRYYSSRRERTE